MLTNEEFLGILTKSPDMDSMSSWIRSLVRRELGMEPEHEPESKTEPKAKFDKSTMIRYAYGSLVRQTWENFEANVADGLLASDAKVSPASEMAVSSVITTAAELLLEERRPWMTHVVIR